MKDMFAVRTFLCCAIVVFSLGDAGYAYAQSTPPSQLPLLHLSDFQYEGAFRLPANTFGSSSLNYSEGPIEYNHINNSIFIVGHSHHQAIAEFPVPALVNSSAITDLNMAGHPIQNFSSVLDRAANGNPQNINRIGGMEYVLGPNGPELLINAYEYYDASGTATHTTLAVRDASNIADSQISGYFKLTGRAHAAGWISPIPLEWQSTLGGTHIAGNSSGTPIISRHSVGPSAFVFDPFDIVGNGSVPDPIPTITLLDFSLDHPLHNDLSNTSGNNDLWTHLSRVVYGFIVPGTRTYVTLGYSGGHESGVCYKCTQDNGRLCGGYCTPLASDNYQYYWLWDVNDLVSVKNRQMNAYEVRPYEYGKFVTPIRTTALGGGTFDPSSGFLYLTVQRADREQGTYANPPVIIVYKFNPGMSGSGGRDTRPPAVPMNFRTTP